LKYFPLPVNAATKNGVQGYRMRW